MSNKELLEAEAALAKFLQDNPHLIPAQRELEKELDKCKSQEERLIFLQKNIEENIKRISNIINNIWI